MTRLQVVAGSHHRVRSSASPPVPRGDRNRVINPTPVIRVRYRRPADWRSRPQRWDDAVAELIALQAEYVVWFEGLPDGFRATATAEALRAIADLDLTELRAIIPPRGFGRD